MAQVTARELHSFESFRLFHVAMLAVFPSEGDVDVGDGLEARVADGGAADLAAEILEEVLAVAQGLEVNVPVPVPALRGDGGQPGAGVSGCSPWRKRWRKRVRKTFWGRQEVCVFDGDELVGLIQSRSGDDGVKVGMKEPVAPAAAPGVGCPGASWRPPREIGRRRYRRPGVSDVR